MKKSPLVFVIVFVIALPYNIYADKMVWDIDNSAEFNAFLDSASIRNPNNDITINLQKSTTYNLQYPVDRNNVIQPIRIRSNITIQGPEGCEESEMPLIMINSFPEGDDAIIEFGNENPTVMAGSVTLRNFRIEVLPALMTNGEKFMFKFNRRAECNIFNLNSTNSTDRVTNMDFRNCHNIGISNCRFSNANASIAPDDATETVGGCVWLRGNTENAYIHDNIFKKHGNDEIIAVYSSSSLLVDNIIRNISIKDNIFEYGTLLEESHINNMLISFYTSPKDAKTGRWANNNMENIEFSNNTIYIKDHCRRILYFGLSKYDNYAGLKVCDNTIVHDYSARSPEQASVIDLWIRNRDISDPRTVKIQEPLKISGNSIYVSETLWGGKNGHIILDIDGSKVNFHNNLVDCSRFSFINKPDWQASRPYLCFFSGDSIDCHIDNNRIYGIGMQSSTDNNPSTPMISNLKFSVTNNIIEGNIQNYWPKLWTVQYLFSCNTCTGINDNCILFNGFGREGNNTAVITNNLFARPFNSSTYGYLAYVTSNPNVQKYILTGNTFVGVSVSNVHTFTWMRDSTVAVTGNNTFDF